MDDWGVAPALCLFSAVLRLSLPKGEGRVRVCGFSARTVSEPLTSILSPFTKGRGGQKRAEFIGALIREVICDALLMF
jgi:hypothetical protein